MPRPSAGACGRASTRRTSTASGSCSSCSWTAWSSPVTPSRSATRSPPGRRASGSRFVDCEQTIKVVFLYNLLDLKRTAWEGPELGAGRHTIVFDFKSDGPGLGKGGTGVLYVDGRESARNSLEHTTPITFPEDETFDVG